MSKTCFLFVVLLAIISQCLTVARKATLPPEYDTSNPRLMGSVSILSPMGIGTIVWSVSAFLGLCCFLSMSAFMDTKRAKAEEQNEAKAQSMSELRDRLNVLRAKELELEQARVKYAQMFHTYEAFIEVDKNIRQITDDRKIAEVHRGRKVVSELARKNKLEGGHGVTTQAMRKKVEAEENAFIADVDRFKKRVRVEGESVLKLGKP